MSIQNIFKALPHNSAYAYVPGRSTVDALKIHQENKSKWFLKLDIKNFFPNCTPDLIMAQLKQIFPFEILFKNPEAYTKFYEIVQSASLDGALPQGSPASPALTNLLMLPYDYQIQKTLWDFDKQTFKYTRYADDLLISCKYKFNYQKIENKIQDLISPFRINTEKTRFGSSAGSNWNLGLMLNKDNQITIGHKRKQRFKAAIFSFLSDLKNGVHWDIIDAQILLGEYSYFRRVEPDYIDAIMIKYKHKFNLDPKQELVNLISS